MNARIIVTPTGQVTILVDEAVDYAAAARGSQAIMEALGQALNVEIVIAPPEQHRHGPEYEHQLAHAAAQAHSH